jgi:transketolase
MLLYSLLHLTGYDLPLAEIQRFRQWGSKTPGHPERGHTPGVEVTTGPLGQGFANGVGLAIAESYLAARYNRPGFSIVDHFTYGLVSDGDLMEGVASEAASLAGHLKLGKLIYLYDNNHMTLSAATDVSFTEDRAKRFQAYGWRTFAVEDGNDLDAIRQALTAAREPSDRPSLILVNTHLGYGSPHKQDTFAAHGSPLGKDETRLTKENLGWPDEPAFYLPNETLAHFRQAISRGQKLEDEWNKRLAAYAKKRPETADELRRVWRGELPPEWDADIPFFPPSAKGEKTRVASGRVLNAIAKHTPTLIGGSGDLDPSTETQLKEMGEFESPALAPADRQGAACCDWNYAGRNIAFGVREHAMAGILNGLAAYGGLTPFGATFFAFSDYLRPALRLAALSGLHVIYVFTHDSIGLGEDGPTHQPVEHLASLRAMPNLTVIRPADANETAEAWRVAMTTTGRPVALVLTRQNVPTLDRRVYAPAAGLRRGGYVLADAPGGPPDVILIATGSEVALAVGAAAKLAEYDVRARVVSLPSWDLFEAQTAEYRNSVLPPEATKRLSIEAAATFGWRRWIGDEGDAIGLDRFGASAPGEKVMAKLGFSVENVVARALALLRRERRP